MTFALITHVGHVKTDGQLLAYGPYVREMNLWAQHVDHVVLVAPAKHTGVDPIDLAYKHTNITWLKVPAFSTTSLGQLLRSILVVPWILLQIFRAFIRADHIHLRAPGNMAILGLLVQVFFPSKKKTAKYAGNWDPNAKQPVSYRLQKRMLASSWFACNMRVLVYGAWPNQSKNVLPFFTATYSKNEIPWEARDWQSPVRMLFIGTLGPGKRPLYALQLFKSLYNKGLVGKLDYFGDGPEKPTLLDFVKRHDLSGAVQLHGNRPAAEVNSAYKTADFLILPSQSEGWPKVVAEAMYWGCIPVVTPISCVPWMLDHGERGMLLSLVVEIDSQAIADILIDPNRAKQMRELAVTWSRSYTLDRFDTEIQKLLK